MAKQRLFEEVRTIYTREHRVFQTDSTFSELLGDGPSSLAPEDQRTRPASSRLTGRDILRLARETAQASQGPVGVGADFTAPLHFAIARIRTRARNQLEQEMRHFSGSWHSATNQIDSLARRVEWQRKVVQEARAARENSESRWRTAQSLSSEGDPLPRDIRTVPTPLYLLVLAIASATVGFLSIDSFRVLAVNDPARVVLACMYAVIFAVSIHVVSQSIGNGWRLTPTVLISVAHLALLIASGIALGHLDANGRGGRSSLLLVLTSTTALLTGSLYQREPAVTLRQLQKEAVRESKRLRDAETTLRQLKDELERTRHQRFEAVDAALRGIKSEQTHAEELQRSLLSALRQLRADVDWPAEVSAVELPDSIKIWQEWLIVEAREIAHPVHFSARAVDS